MAIIDRIKYDAPTTDILVWKWRPAPTKRGEVRGEEIRMGAQLIVNEAQEAIFFKGGQALDILGPGTHTLSTSNLPLLTGFIKMPFGAKTPFTAEIWYVNKTVKRDLRWGTKTPIPIIDPEYNYPVNVRSFGRWGIRVADSRSFITQIVGTLKISTSYQVEEYFAGELGQRFSDALAEFIQDKKNSVFSINAKLNELSKYTAGEMSKELDRFGIEIVNFNVERVSIPAEEMAKFQEIFGKRMEIEQISKAEVGKGYTTMRTYDTLEKAASSEGGAGNLMGTGLGLGLGFGAGMPVGQQLGQSLNPQGQQDAPSEDPVETLKKLKQMLDEGLITAKEYDAKKAEILKKM